MPRSLSPQARFLLRATLNFGALLAIWWFLLLPALLGWTRMSTDVLLSALPQATVQTGVSTTPAGVWVIQVPVKTGGIARNVRVEAPQRLPTQLTLALPLYWSIVFAVSIGARSWRILAAGTAILLLLPPIGLIIYAAHVVRIYVYPGAPVAVERVLAWADYIASTVAPYVGPVLLALALDKQLRETILALDPQPVQALPSRR